MNVVDEILKKRCVFAKMIRAVMIGCLDLVSPLFKFSTQYFSISVRKEKPLDAFQKMHLILITW